MASSIKSWGVTVYLLTSGMPASGFEDRINMGGRVSSTSWSNMKFRTCACCDSDSLRTFTCSDSSSPGYPRVKAVKRGCCCYYVNILLDVQVTDANVKRLREAIVPSPTTFLEDMQTFSCIPRNINTEETPLVC